MGLKGFYPLLKRCKYVPDAVVLTDLVGKTIAMDGDYFLYKAMHGATSGTCFTASDLAECILRWLRMARKAGIMTTFVTTGGSPPIEKVRNCLTGRKRKRSRQQDQIKAIETTLTTTAPACSLADELILRDRLCMIQDASRTIDPIMAANVVLLIQAAGFDCVESVSEADFMLTLLSEQGRCDYVATDDADILVSGAKRTIRGLTSLLSAGVPARVFERDQVLVAMALTSPQLLELGCLLTCDYQPPIPKVGPVTALHMIRAHGTVKGFLESDAFTCPTKKRRRYVLPASMTTEDYIRQCSRSVDIFKSRPDTHLR